MRIASYTSNQGNVSTLQQRQQALQQAQEQMSSGKRIAKPSDDPAGIAIAERALNAQKRAESSQRALAASRNAMTLSESAIGNATDLIQNAREALMNAGNGTYSAAERKTLAVQLRELRGQLLTVANQSDGSTGHLFGGQGATAAPFVDSPDGVISQATGGASNAAPTEKLPLSVDGAAVWLSANSGNGVFATDTGELSDPNPANTGTGRVDVSSVIDASKYNGAQLQVVIGQVGGKPSYTIKDESGNVAKDASGKPIQNLPLPSATTSTGSPASTSITDVPGLSFKITGTPAAGDSFTIKRNTGSGWINAGQVNDPSSYTGKDYQVVVGGTTANPSYSIMNVTDNPNVSVVKNQPFATGKAITDIPGISFNISGTPAPGDSFTIKPSTPDLSVFGAIDKVLGALENPQANSGQVMQAVNSGLRDVDQVLGNFQSARAVAGETLNRLDGMENRTSAAILSAQTTRSNAEDIDMVQAVSDFTNKQTSYQAALQSYSMVQKLSLFNYINP